jgi:hypothetical protein
MDYAEFVIFCLNVKFAVDGATHILRTLTGENHLISSSTDCVRRISHLLLKNIKFALMTLHVFFAHFLGRPPSFLFMDCIPGTNVEFLIQPLTAKRRSPLSTIKSK